MSLTARAVLSQFAHLLQSTLFPTLRDTLGPLTPELQQVVAILALIPLDKFIAPRLGQVGHPPRPRQNLATAFIAKARLSRTQLKAGRRLRSSYATFSS